ncbi:MAG TPA: GntR family transcriptional regulator [Symbiobacteriaceae bacterium]|nr:GntR family transcriptional regulator [Symbiobacteriaceae bacterium]
METPFHDQIRTYLLEEIRSGRLGPGDRVPSEWELSQQFAVSRMTARQAVSALEMQGYLRRERGRGTFVAQPKLEQPLTGLTGFTDEMVRRGLTASTRVLAAGAVPAERPVADALGLPEQTPVYRLDRLRLADGTPMALEVCHIPVAYVPDLLTTGRLTESLYKVLSEQYAIRLTRATQVLEVATAAPPEHELLDVPVGAPLLLLQRVARDHSDRPVEYARSLYRGDRYRFSTALFR